MVATNGMIHKNVRLARITSSAAITDVVLMEPLNATETITVVTGVMKQQNIVPVKIRSGDVVRHPVKIQTCLVIVYQRSCYAMKMEFGTVPMVPYYSFTFSMRLGLVKHELCLCNVCFYCGFQVRMKRIAQAFISRNTTRGESKFFKEKPEVECLKYTKRLLVQNKVVYISCNMQKTKNRRMKFKCFPNSQLFTLLYKMFSRFQQHLIHQKSFGIQCMFTF